MWVACRSHSLTQGEPMKKILLGVVIALVLIIGGCIALVGGVASEVSKGIEEAEAREYAVLYEVTGTAKRALVTYSSTTSGDIAQDSAARIPWKKRLTMGGDVIPTFTLTAQNSGGGTIGCKVTVDGEVIAENRSRGRFAVVSCDGTLG